MQNTAPNLTFNAFFHSYIFSEDEACLHLCKKDQKRVKVAKIFISLITLGVLPIFCERNWGNIQDCKNQVKNLALQLNNSNYFNLPEFVEDADLVRQSKNQDCNRILNGLFLGSSKGFVETTTLKFNVLEDFLLKPTQFTNKYEFKSVITMCPIEAITADYTELDKNEITRNFANNNVTWIHPGKDLADHENSGFDLAFNSTFPNSEVILETFVGKTKDELDLLSKQKKNCLNAHNIQIWFEPVFAEMDKAVLGRGKTLIHCQAGISRSPTLVAAYLINRFGLSVEMSINYLRNKRACVKPKFIPFLAEYAERLNSVP